MGVSWSRDNHENNIPIGKENHKKNRLNFLKEHLQNVSKMFLFAFMTKLLKGA